MGKSNKETVRQFTERLRKKQSYYRVNVLHIEECGIGPTEHSKSTHPNMLIKGEVTGKNFLNDQIFEYAKYRVEKKGTPGHKHETIDAYRLFNNMLSSQPMAFNLFCPFRQMLEKGLIEAVSSIMSAIFPDMDIKTVTNVDVEYIRDNIEDYLNDKTAMDAVIMYKDTENKECIIAIETKYTDVLGENTASKGRHLERIEELKCFKPEIESQLKGNKIPISQIYRNFLLTEVYARDKQNPLNRSYSVVLSPKEHPTTEQELSSLQDELKEEFKNKIRRVPLEDFVSITLLHCPNEYTPIFKEFEKRYLNY